MQGSGWLQRRIGCRLFGSLAVMGRLSRLTRLYVFTAYRNHYRKFWWQEAWHWKLCLGNCAVTWSSSNPVTLSVQDCVPSSAVWMDVDCLWEVGGVTILHTWVGWACDICVVCMCKNMLALFQFSQIVGHRRSTYYHSCSFSQLPQVRHGVCVSFQFLQRAQYLKVCNPANRGQLGAKREPWDLEDIFLTELIIRKNMVGKF